MRYVEGRPIPPGYHLESRPQRGLVISGACLLAIPYSLSASVAASSRHDGDAYLLIPVIGPFIDLSTRNDNSSADSGARFSLTLDGLLQTAGAALLIIGVAVPEKFLERDDAPLARRQAPTFAWSIAPRTLGRNGLGVGVVGEF
jgi:hypothetical protein